ncbi:unnamed protein product [Blepharisma stoltei]|uniref:Uncharacterized protein n=1 Tax=Blepharisma stoltei TaxID=1481888 RepID=A0AAU9IV77_9CILI|nr:unnamed protein product [Blepharisma stoltei]
MSISEKLENVLKEIQNQIDIIDSHLKEISLNNYDPSFEEYLLCTKEELEQKKTTLVKEFSDNAIYETTKIINDDKSNCPDIEDTDEKARKHDESPSNYPIPDESPISEILNLNNRKLNKSSTQPLIFADTKTLNSPKLNESWIKNRRYENRSNTNHEDSTINPFELLEENDMDLKLDFSKPKTLIKRLHTDKEGQKQFIFKSASLKSESPKIFHREEKEDKSNQIFKSANKEGPPKNLQKEGIAIIEKDQNQAVPKSTILENDPAKNSLKEIADSSNAERTSGCFSKHDLDVELVNSIDELMKTDKTQEIVQNIDNLQISQNNKKTSQQLSNNKSPERAQHNEKIPRSDRNTHKFGQNSKRRTIKPPITIDIDRSINEENLDELSILELQKLIETYNGGVDIQKSKEVIVKLSEIKNKAHEEILKIREKIVNEKEKKIGNFESLLSRLATPDTEPSPKSADDCKSIMDDTANIKLGLPPLSRSRLNPNNSKSSSNSPRPATSENIIKGKPPTSSFPRPQTAVIEKKVKKVLLETKSNGKPNNVIIRTRLHQSNSPAKHHKTSNTGEIRVDALPKKDKTNDMVSVLAGLPTRIIPDVIKSIRRSRSFTDLKTSGSTTPITLSKKLSRAELSPHD